MPAGVPPVFLPDALTKLSTEDIKTYAAQIAVDIRKYLPTNQRRAVADYGRCLLTSTAPSQRQTHRFIAALRSCKSYRHIADPTHTNIAVLHQLQNEIARRVAGA